MTIGLYNPSSNLLTFRFTDDTEFIPDQKQKIFIVSYRLNLLYKDGSCEISAGLSYDFWWKKYLRFIEHYEHAPYVLAGDIFRIIEESVKNVVYKKYISLLCKRNIDKSFIVDEACQEILLKLLEKRSHPGTNYYSFWKYINSVAANWLISFLVKSNRHPMTKLTDDVLELERSPEDRMISGEENHAFLRAFSNLFNVYLDELWTTLPMCAFIIESWIRRKKGFLKNFTECFSTNNDEWKFDVLRIDDLEIADYDSYNLYGGILSDISAVYSNERIRRDVLKKVPEKKRASFEASLAEYSETEYDKSINRIKQRVNRALAIIRVKMEEDLNNF